MSKTTPEQVLEAATPRGAASRLAAYLRELAESAGYSPDAVALWSPTKTKELGWGSGWAVCWEGGPYDWAVSLSLGSGLMAGASGSYSKPGPFPGGLNAKGWFAEPYNGFILNFYPV